MPKQINGWVFLLGLPSLLWKSAYWLTEEVDVDAIYQRAGLPIE
jgi:hypothetical protein